MICPNCGKDFETKHFKQKYCSNNCCKRYWETINREKHLKQKLDSAMRRYNSLSIDERRKERNTKYYKYLKKCDRYMKNNSIRALTRYYYEKEECALCGCKDSLEFHHYTMNVDDFIVLCKSCHHNLHKNLEDE